MIITEGDGIILTPTYHVFDMFKDFQGATLLPLEVTGDQYRFGDQSMPAIIAGTARLQDGRIKLALVNVDPHQAHDIAVPLPAGTITGEILSGPQIASANSRSHPDTVAPRPFSGFRRGGQDVTVQMPAKSIVVLTIG